MSNHCIQMPRFITHIPLLYRIYCILLDSRGYWILNLDIHHVILRVEAGLYYGFRNSMSWDFKQHD